MSRPSNHMNKNELALALKSLPGADWSIETASVWLAAHFNCEYCGLFLLDSPDSYKQGEVDHIVPKVADGGENEENLALACRPCNVHWKATWDPRKVAGQGATRPELVTACTQHVRDQRLKAENYLATVRQLWTKNGG